jgi:diazepam-binding inhibitor (GABA receptor modulating acyl-CoA-binding protein)
MTLRITATSVPTRPLTPRLAPCFRPAPIPGRPALTQASFSAAAERVKALPSKPSDDELLKLYGLFKQAVVGDCNTAQPGFFDLTGKAKWAAWNANKGMAQADAKAAYVAFVDSLQKK